MAGSARRPARTGSQGQADYDSEQRRQNPQLFVAQVLCTLNHHSCDKYHEGDSLALLDLVIFVCLP